MCFENLERLMLWFYSNNLFTNAENPTENGRVQILIIFNKLTKYFFRIWLSWGGFGNMRYFLWKLLGPCRPRRFSRRRAKCWRASATHFWTKSAHSRMTWKEKARRMIKRLPDKSKMLFFIECMCLSVGARDLLESICASICDKKVTMSLSFQGNC